MRVTVGGSKPFGYKKPVQVVLIAAKQLELAKTRLAHAWNALERRALAEAMFRDVLAAAMAARRAARVAVVSSDARLLGLAHEAGALAVDEGFARGLNAAVAMATGLLVGLGATGLCTVLSDIPMVAAEDIDAVLEALGPAPAAVLVPSRDLSGTNIIARRPAGAIPTRFGNRSLLRHLEECRVRRVACRVMQLARPAIDLDTTEDLSEFVRVPTITHTYNHLTRLGLASI